MTEYNSYDDLYYGDSVVRRHEFLNLDATKDFYYEKIKVGSKSADIIPREIGILLNVRNIRKLHLIDYLPCVQQFSNVYHYD